MENKIKQFRNSCYWVHPEGKVYKFYPAKTYKQKWINKKGEVRLHKSKSKINGKEYGVDRWKLLKPTQRKNGYWVFNLQDQSLTGKKAHKGGYFNISLHQIVAECFIGPCPDGYEVDHIDSNKSNNNISNLQYLTKEENIKKGLLNK